MKTIYNLHKRLIYAYVFKNKYVYVGLTYNIKKRHGHHKHIGSVFEYSKYSVEDIPNYIIMSDYMDISEAKIMEGKILKKFLSKGYSKINKIITGGIGYGIRKYKYKKDIILEAKNYTHKKDFAKHSHAAYEIAREKGYLDDVCKHMKSNKHWNNISLKKEAKKYASRNEFKKKSASAYRTAQRLNILNSICKHMYRPIVHNFKWSKINCEKASLKCKGRSYFQKKYGRAYEHSRKNGWLDEFYPKNK